MAYPPSSPVSHFKVIFSISNLNDWLIADGVFFVIRYNILLSNKIVGQNDEAPYFRDRFIGAYTHYNKTYIESYKNILK